MYVTVIVRDVFGFEFGRYVYDTGCGKLAIAGHKPFVVGHDKFHVVDMEVGIFSYPYEKESEETGSEVSEDSAVENQEVVDPNAGAATDEANNGTPTNGENQEVQQAE